MQKLLIVALVLLSLTAFVLFQSKPVLEYQSKQDLLMAQFRNWMKVYNQNFTSNDLMYRISVFADNVQLIESVNAQNLSYTYAVNQFAATTKEEFISTYLGALSNNRNTSVNATYNVTGTMDWRTQGAVTPVKDQGQCGSCWAFSTTGTVEGYSKLFDSAKTLKSFSESQLVDCDTANFGCNGGWPYKALQYVQTKGIATESQYPYTPRTSTCKMQGGSFKINRVDNTNSGSCSELVTRINKAPTSVCVDANNWSFYSGGVFSNCGTSIDHAVLAVGYDASGNWIVKNSWATSWGNSGYITLKAGNTCAVCSTLANAF